MRIVVLDDNGQQIGGGVLKAKTFSSGSRGFHGSFKVEVSETERYQSSGMMVLIGSKPKK